MIVRMPVLRLATTTPTDVSSSTSIFERTLRKKMQPAENTNVSESIQNAHSMLNAEASRPAPANPMAVEPNEAIERKALAAASSSSDAISGIRLS